jgi:hypothetical protein
LQKQQAFEDWINDPQMQKKFAADLQAQTQQFESDIQAVAMDHAKRMEQAKADPSAPVPTLQPPPTPNLLELTPLRWMKWWNAPRHMSEFLKWANDDHVRAIIAQNPLALQLLNAHMDEISQNMPKAPAEPPKVNFSFAEDAMQDPEVRQYFEQTTGVSPTPAPAPRPQAVKPVGGAGRAMANSNSNSAPAGNKGQQEQGMKKAA